MAYHIDATGDIVIDSFGAGIGSDPYSGLTDLKGVNVSSIGNEASVAFASAAVFKCPSGTGIAATTITTGNYLLVPTSVKLETSQWVVITSAGTSGLTTNTPYWCLSSGTDGFGNYRYELFTATAVFPPSSSQATISANSSVTLTIISPGQAALSGETSLGINFFTKSSSNNFAIDCNGRIWSDLYLTGYEGSTGDPKTNSWTYIGNTTLTNASGNGLVVYKTVHDSTGGFGTTPEFDEWLFVFRNSAIDYLQLSSAGAVTYTWHYGWDPSLGTTGNLSGYLYTPTGVPNPHHAIIAPDDRVYFTDANFIWCFYQNVPLPGDDYVGFSPTNSGQIYTLTENLYENAVSATLSSDWGGSSGVYLGTFSDNEQRYVTFTGSSTALTWSTGLTGNVNATIQVGLSYTFSTYTILPFNDIAQCISFLNSSILIGGTKNIIYPWDLTSPTYSTPLILLPENNISSIVTVGQNAYIFAGNRGNIYITQGSQASPFKKVSDHISGQVEPLFYWGSFSSSLVNAACPQCATYTKNRLYFSISGSYQNGSDITGYGGIWCIDLGSNALFEPQELSYGSYNGTVGAIGTSIGNIAAGSTYGPNEGYGLIAGWGNGSGSYGVDVDIASPYTNGSSSVVSDLIPIGTLLHLGTPYQFEYKLSMPLQVGETVQLFAGYSLADYINGTMTSLGTTTGDGTQLSDNFPTLVENQQWLIVQAVLTSIASNPSYNRLVQMRVIGDTLKTQIPGQPYALQ